MILTREEILERIFCRLLKESNSGGYIYIFDFDDTLVKTSALIHVRNFLSKELKRSLSPSEYAKDKSLSDDEEFDFRDFEHVIEPRLTNVFYSFVNLIRNHGPGKVFILTARGNPVPVKNFLKTIEEEYRLPASKVEVMAVGSSDPMAKVVKIKEKIVATGAGRVKFYDDSLSNIEAADLLNDDPDVVDAGVRIETRHVRET